jgi:hypothetical protein
VLYGPDGRTLRTWTLPSSVGRLRASSVATDGTYTVLGFRPGSASLVTVEMPAGRAREWSSPSPVFDAAVLPPDRGDEGARHRYVLGTLEGLLEAHGSEGPWVRAEGISTVSGIHMASGADGISVVALEPGGSLLWLDDRREVLRSAAGPAGGWFLVGGVGGEVGVAPSGVRSAVTGRFLGPASRQAAVTTESGQLLLAGLETGRIRFRAHWDGIDGLAAGDLLGEGTDVLVLAAGKYLAVVGAGESS